MHRFCIYLLFPLLLLPGCTHHMSQNPETSTSPLPAFDKEGHRGARGLMPENTIPGMLKALELGVTTLEMDVHISKDKRVVLSHDPYMNPDFVLLPTGAEIPAAEARKHVLYQLDYSQIREFDAGSRQNPKFPEQQPQKAHKPLLAEVIDAVQKEEQQKQLPQPFYNIETKSKPGTDGQNHPEPAEFVQLLMQVVEEKNIVPWVIIQSFDVRTLQVLQAQYPGVKTSLLVENLRSLDWNLEQLGFTPTIYSPYYKLVTPKLIQACHAKGIKVIPWTVNELHEMQLLQQMGADGIISDYPNLFQEL
ncbi:glycerophosphodiester phosphodiesterase [Pontibacter beigongshangensis]|uniref:glycerophosphodiester phosphodiesterase n=1 Tax=Pontibacter beigongshangensis TaxID=2574733 RepID=UPI00164F423E|nr:glycerophosphodiester phosphodiesterase [Pontibacter beigongshangensis]